MWGSITPDTNNVCDWSTAPFNGGNADYNADAFNKVKDTACPNGILAKKYDAATQIMGGDWRMPTSADFNELFNNTSIGWYYDFNGSGVGGWIFMSRIDTSKYIFIPASGYRSGSSSSDQNISVNIWTSSLNVSQSSEAQYLNADSESWYIFSDLRYHGYSVRGVFK